MCRCCLDLGVIQRTEAHEEATMSRMAVKFSKWTSTPSVIPTLLQCQPSQLDQMTSRQIQPLPAHD